MSDTAIQTSMVPTNGLTLETATAGDPSKPPLLMLHGFPDLWLGWKRLIPELAKDFHVIAPNQRGYAASSRPTELKAYRIQNMVADALGLLDALAPGRKALVFGHDWGASAAYSLAMAAPDRVARLVIANGVHPVPFQRALLDDPAQRKASQYIRLFRRADGARIMSEDGFKRLGAWFSHLGETELPQVERDAYHAAWEIPGALDAMMNWYRASPLVVPEPDEIVTDRPAWLNAPGLGISMPHLLVWGPQDHALLPVSRKGLDVFAPDLTLVEVPGATHWILRERPDAVLAAVHDWLSSRGTGV